jgi:isopentenyl diphosphate isomerase/L-lactate dehydrogenase-like FMN-dependent dehydrogenase
MDASSLGQVQFYQLCGRNCVPIRNLLTRPSRYVNKDRNITKKLVQHAEKRGIKGLFITVDAPQLGRREKVFVTFVPMMRILTGEKNRTCG